MDTSAINTELNSFRIMNEVLAAIFHEANLTFDVNTTITKFYRLTASITLDLFVTHFGGIYYQISHLERN